MKYLKPARTLVMACALIGAGLGTAAHAADPPAAVQRGNAKFQGSCAPCHGAGLGSDGRAALPGTTALQLKYKGALPALLEARKDLTVEMLKAYLRNGSWSMPPFRKTELTDQEIADIAAYLATTPKAEKTAGTKAR
jgi:mono/diheme cytochrome c family protein